MERSGFAVDNHTKLDVRARVLTADHFLLDPRESLFQVERGTTRRAQSSNGVPAFFNHLPHQFHGSSERRLYTRIRRKLTGHHVNLHGSAHETLQESIVQLLRDASSLGQAFLKSKIATAGNLSQSNSVNSQNRRYASQNDSRAKPPGLPEQRVHSKSEPGFFGAPNPVLVGRHHAETIAARSKIGIDGVPRGNRLAPVAIEAVQPVPVTNPIRNRKNQTGVAERDSSMPTRNTYPRRHTNWRGIR